jgi:hypothetical protein
MQQELATPVRKAAVVAVIENPFANKYQKDLATLEDMGEPLGELMANMARHALGIEATECEGYGKGAVVGTSGELEHGHAVLHEKFGRPVRQVFGGGKAIIPSSGKVGVPGTPIDVPTVYKHAFAVRSHYDSMAVVVPDAPRADEIMLVLVLTTSGRPLARASGLRKEDVKGEDGLR